MQYHRSLAFTQRSDVITSTAARMSQRSADRVHLKQEIFNKCLRVFHWRKLACHCKFLEHHWRAVVCGYWLEPYALCAGSGFIRSCCYWKWIPWAIWIQLIQLNTVNNWSDSETEPCHMGAVTSSFEGWNRTPVQLDCPRSFVPQSLHCIWLPPVKDIKQTTSTGGEVTLALSCSARVYNDNGPTDSRSLETHEIVTCRSLQTWTE